jgi:hypothetical protein
MTNLKINGALHNVEVPEDTPLLSVLHDVLGMTATKSPSAAHAPFTRVGTFGSKHANLHSNDNQAAGLQLHDEHGVRFGRTPPGQLKAFGVSPANRGIRARRHLLLRTTTNGPDRDPLLTDRPEDELKPGE